MLKTVNPNLNKSVISITILLSIILSVFVLADPTKSSKLLSDTYIHLSSIFEVFYMYGSFFLLFFLLFIALSKYGSIIIQ